MTARVRLESLDPHTPIGQLEYEFEELGIEIADGFEAGSFNGSAEIEYFPDSTFAVLAIYLNVSKLTANKWESQNIKLDIRGHQALWCAIERSIQKKAKDDVQEAIWRLQ